MAKAAPYLLTRQLKERKTSERFWAGNCRKPITRRESSKGKQKRFGMGSPAALRADGFGQKKVRRPAHNRRAVKKSAGAFFRPVDYNGLGATVSRRRRQLPKSGRALNGPAITYTKRFGQKKSPAATYFRGAKPLSSARESLTSVFGMGTGIASPPWPPDNNNQIITSNNEGKKREDGGRQKNGPIEEERLPFLAEGEIWPSLAAY